MSLVKNNRSKATKNALTSVCTLVILLFLIQTSHAAFDTIYFSVNGDTTATTMVQGDTFGWGSNCELGASINWEIYFDANSNGVIDKGVDVILTAEQITDGNLLTEGTSVADGQVFVGTFELSLEPGTYLFRATDLATNSSIENSIGVTAMSSPPNQLTGTISLPGVSAPSPLLENILIFAEADGSDGAFGAITDQNGYYSIEIGSSGNGLEFYIEPGNTYDFVTPSGTSAFASGVVSNLDFLYEIPADSVYGYVNILTRPALLYESRIRASSMGMDKSALTSNGRYVIYFSEAEKGDWSIGSDSRNSPAFVTIDDLYFSHDTISSFQQGVNMYDANSIIYVSFTEDGLQPVNHYRLYIYSPFMNSYAEAVTDTGTNSVSAVPVSAIDGFGWQVSVDLFDEEFPIPDGYAVVPSFHSNIAPGDTVEFNLVSGIQISGQCTIDPGDTPPDWSQFQISAFDTLGNYFQSSVNPDGSYSISVSEGEYYINALENGMLIQGYTVSPYLHTATVSTDTSGFDFIFNQAHCRVTGTLLNVEGIGSDTYVTAYTGDGSFSESYAFSPVSLLSETYELFLSEGDWTIVGPSEIANVIPPDPLPITIGEIPDTLRVVDLVYTVIGGCCVGYTGNIDNSFDDGSLGSIDINDLVYMVDFMFRGGESPVCMDEANVTGGVDGIDIVELVYLVNFMFGGGPAPVPCP